MAIKIRSTESLAHPIWLKLISEYPVSDIQGFIFEATDSKLIEATNKGEKSIKIHCLEAAEYETQEEFIPKSFFTKEEWTNKIMTSRFFESKMLLLSYMKNDNCLFRLHEALLDNDEVKFSEIDIFADEPEFMKWWNSIKKLSQTKRTYEARKRQDQTLFDEIIERNGSAWGGNIDGFVLSDDKNQVKAIIEVRQTHNFPIDKYDPAKFFLGTQTKSGDFKTWLPLIYLKRAYNIPIILITISSIDKTKFGFTEVESMDKKALYYKDKIHPFDNVTNDFNDFKEWLKQIIEQ